MVGCGYGLPIHSKLVRFSGETPEHTFLVHIYCVVTQAGVFTKECRMNYNMKGICTAVKQHSQPPAHANRRFPATILEIA